MKLPWQFRKIKTRLVVRDADGDGPLFVIEGGYNEQAVGLIERLARGRGLDLVSSPDEERR